MRYNVILSKRNGHYIARAKEWPEITVVEDSRDAAISQLKSQLLEYLTHQVEVIQIDLSLPSETGNPWLDKFGYFNDDPTFDDLQAEIAAYRQEINQESATSAD